MIDSLEYGSIIIESGDIMKCIHCGGELIEGDFFCTSCGARIESNPTAPVTVYQQTAIPIEDKKAADRLCITSLLLYFVGPIILMIIDAFLSVFLKEATVLFTVFSFISRIAGIATMVFARIKYPDSKFAKTLMWVYIILFIIGFVLTTIVILIVFIAIMVLLN